jgi:2-polyprenyl-3-methyl-5-hydroxy-6-metoxy-1,4-benzoquinol methylase
MAFKFLIPVLKTKIYSFLHSTVLYRFGYGNRVAKGVWEKQYSGADWDFLFSENEKGHYGAIISQLQNQTLLPKVLDIGCGQGALYQYFDRSLSTPFDYMGIDIAENAIKKAADKFPGGNFKVVNYDYTTVTEKFSAVIFNEVLYYFVKPIKTLEKAFAENVSTGGVVMISMYKDAPGKNNLIWETITEKYHVLKEATITNDKGTTWTVKTITTK